VVLLVPIRKEVAVRVTTKGQVTIPLAVRERLNIQPGTEVDFVVDGNTVRLVPARKGQTRGRRIVDRLRGRASVRMTTDEIMALTRGAR
jgi:AbrB family looped-hinge helix DNA binding protein